MLPGETVGHADGLDCPDCKKPMKLTVEKSAAGFYLGYFCRNEDGFNKGECGPYSRESEYFSTREEAQKALKSFDQHKRTSEYKPDALEVLVGDEALKALGTKS